MGVPQVENGLYSMKTELAAKGMAANRYRIKKVMAAWAGLLLLAVTAFMSKKLFPNNDKDTNGEVTEYGKDK